tara:strand:- start:62 stop:991 length:930 start_codon:yes stop_codon:yes gene_type:complete
MGFKMKGPSIHKGTDSHKKAIEAERAAKIKQQKANKNVGEGFMHPPYKDTASGTKPYAKRQGYHGYKDFDSNIEQKEDAEGKDTNIKTPKVMKDGPKNRMHFHKKSPNKMHAKGHKKTREDYLNEGFSQVEADQMAKDQGVSGKVKGGKSKKAKKSTTSAHGQISDAQAEYEVDKKILAKKKSKRGDAGQMKLPKKAKKPSRPKPLKPERREPTWEGTDEFRKPEDIPASEYEERGMKKPKKKSPNKLDLKRIKAGVKGAVKGALSTKGEAFPGKKWDKRYPGVDIIHGYKGAVAMHDKKKKSKKIAKK